MRVLIVNSHWYSRDRAAVSAIDTADLLRRRGHEVGVYTLDHPMCSAGEPVWLAPPCASATRRALYGKGVGESLRRALDEFGPQVVHLHNVHGHLSPLVAQLAHDRGCRVVWTLHDLRLVCPRGTAQRGGKPCYRCLDHPLDVVNRRCVGRTWRASVTALLEASQWNTTRLERWVDVFVAQSESQAQRLRQAQIPAGKIAVLHGLVPQWRREMAVPAAEREAYGCFADYTLTRESGIGTLLAVADDLSLELRVAGGGMMFNRLLERYYSSPNIRLVGSNGTRDLTRLLSRAAVAVVPAEWDDPSGQTALEALAVGTPVVCTTVGALPELVRRGCGILVPPRDRAAQSDALRRALDTPWDHAAIAASIPTEQQHYETLMRIYGEQG